VRYHVLASDYDGTLASQGLVDDETLQALERLRLSGRKLVMVTGRELDDLGRVFPHLDLFDRIVAENGALLYCPATREVRSLGEAPPEEFVAALLRLRIPLSAGRVIVATWEPHETAVLETIRDLGLELQVVFNKGAVMVLPSGINKATGLRAALDELGLSLRNCVGVGDAENDHAFLSECECGVAVANALDSTRAHADWTTQADHGAGVRELIDALLADDLRHLAPCLERHAVPLGQSADGSPVSVPPYGEHLLIAGTSGSGKSTLAAGFLERLSERGYQTCIIDPEGDYANLDGALVLGDEGGAPGVDEVLTALEQPAMKVVINLVELTFQNRPAYFDRFLPRLQDLCLRTGRPHWFLVDETHHLLPPEREAAAATVAQELHSVLWITVHPDRIAPSLLERIDRLLAIGQEPVRTLNLYAAAAKRPPPQIADRPLAPGEALLWNVREPASVQQFAAHPPRVLQRRHKRKYAQGDLGTELSFYFQGPERRLNLRANNLAAFVQIGEGVDDETWEYHLRRGDYSRWFNANIKDPQLADAVRAVERDATLPPAETRARIRALVDARYTGTA